jgi:hypothetical protein
MYVESISPQIKPLTIETDEYIPLSVQIGNSGLQEIYMRYVSEYSLLELGISSCSGLLTSFKLVQVPSFSSGNESVISSGSEQGLPLFNISLWGGNRMLDVSRAVELLVTNSSIVLILDNAPKAEMVSQNENLSFAISNGYPCWISLDHLTNEQLTSIKESVNQNAPGNYL